MTDRLTRPDDPCRPDADPCEWWYYHGHLRDGDRRFAFHAAFFRRTSADVSIAGLLRASRFGGQGWFAHFAVSDLDEARFHHSVRRHFFLRRAGADANRFRVWVPPWCVREVRGAHRLRVATRAAGLLLSARPEGPCVSHAADGVYRRSSDSVSAYFSFPRMAARGYLRFGRQWRRVEGGVWMDRERGTVRFSRELGGWDWFGLQFRDGRAAMISRIRDAAGQETARSAGTLIEPDGHTTRLGAGEFEVRPLDHWVSPRTGIAYPQRWRIRVPAWDAEWTVTPYLRDQELDTRGGTGVIYWEGAARVAGRASGRSSVGDAFVELSGYDRGRGIRGLYDFETNRIGAGAFLADQVRAIWRCGGVSRRTATVREAEEGVRP